MALADQILIDELLSGQLDLMRYEAGVRQKIFRLLIDLQRELITELGQTNLSVASKARIETVLNQASAIIDRYYVTAAGQATDAAAAVVEAATRNTFNAMRNSLVAQIGVGLPTKAVLKALVGDTLIQGAASAEWWARQAKDVQFRFSTAVRQGVAAAETQEQIVARIAGSPRKGIPGVMDIARSNARGLVHSTLQSVANTARLEAFKKNTDVLDKLEWLATLDGSTCPNICGPRDLKTYTIEEAPQPIGHKFPWSGGPGAIHFGCRCIVVGVRKSFKDLGLDIEEPSVGERASDSGTVPADTSFESFLRRKGQAYQDEVLGPGRAQLWRDKKLTLPQLLDLQGNPLSLTELRSKYG
jgi:hypothetical protein